VRWTKDKHDTEEPAPSKALGSAIGQHAPMTPLKVLLLSDDYPGHFNFAHGVLAAVRRLRPIACEERLVRVLPSLRMRMVRPLVSVGPLGQRLALMIGYGIDARALPKVDLVISGGANTLAANVALARLIGVPNVFCGSLRGGLRFDQFCLVVTSYEESSDDPRHIGTLKPSIFGPEVFNRPPTFRFGADNPPRRASLLIGGDSGRFRYDREEWRALFSFVRAVSAAWGTRWLISTSRRTPGFVADAVSDLARDDGIVELFVDFRTAGPGTLRPIFERAEIMLCTSDSSSMVSEAIAVHLPVVGVLPRRYSFKPLEERYRIMMEEKGWARFLLLAELTLERFASALATISPPIENHLELLACEIRRKLPSLFG
jgi:mitochondrial fission protein ELM1